MLLWFELWSNFDLSLCSNRSKEWENRKGFAALLLVEASTGAAALQKVQDGRTSESCTISILIRYKANTESWQVRLKRIFWKFEIPWKSFKIRNLQLDCHAVMLSCRCGCADQGSLCCWAVAFCSREVATDHTRVPGFWKDTGSRTSDLNDIAFGIFWVFVVYKWPERYTTFVSSSQLNCKQNIVTASGLLLADNFVRYSIFSWHSQRPALTFWSITHPWRFLWDTDKYIDIQLQFIISYVAPCVTRFLLLPVPLLTVPRYCGTWVQYASEVLHHLNEEDSGENSAELFFHMRRGDCFRLLHTMGAKHHRHVFRHL